VQGLALEKAVLDMKAEPRRTSHEKCTSNYVLAGTCRQIILADVHLLQKIDMSDFNPKWMIGPKSLKSKPWQHGVKIQDKQQSTP
jgi:hypothetical protein